MMNSGRGEYRPPAWVQRMLYFNPSERPIKIRVIPTLPSAKSMEDLWFRWYNKWVKITKNGRQVSRNVISNSHNGDLPVPCLLYYYMMDLEKPELRASASDAVTVLVLEDFHKVKKGTSKSGKDYYDYVLCEGENKRFGRSCQNCKDGVEKEFGRLLYWSMWKNARAQFEEELSSLPNRCTHCQKGEISTYGFSCSKCGTEIVNLYNEEVDPDDVEAMKESEFECPHCHVNQKANQMIECVIRHGEGPTASFSEGCKEPAASSDGLLPWQYDITVVEEKVGNGAAVRILKFEEQKNYALPDSKLRPLDLGSFLSHMSLSEQAEALGRPNVFDDEAQALLDNYFGDAPKQESKPATQRKRFDQPDDSPAAPDQEDEHSKPIRWKR